jgi:WD40 repeat protein
VVDLAGGTANFKLPKAHPEGITSVAWSPTGSIIASGSGYVGGPIHLWDAASGKLVNEFPVAGCWVTALDLLPDGQLVTGTCSGAISTWNLPDGKETSPYIGHGAQLFPSPSLLMVNVFFLS